MGKTGKYDTSEKIKSFLSAPVIKRSVRITGHPTSVSIEEPFWSLLQKIAQNQNRSINQLIAEIDELRSTNLSSAIRLYILHNLTQ